MTQNKLYSEENRIASILLNGTPAAKQEIIIKLIYIENINALNSVLLNMSDTEYRRVMPTAQLFNNRRAIKWAKI